MSTQTLNADTKTETSADTLVELDDRRRASFGKIGHHSRYLVHEEPDGTVVMKPAVVLTEAEAYLLGNREVMERIAHQHQHPEQAQPIKPRRPRSERAS